MNLEGIRSCSSLIFSLPSVLYKFSLPLFSVFLLWFLFTHFQRNGRRKRGEKLDPRTFPSKANVSFTGREIPCRNPATLEDLGKDFAATSEEVAQCVKDAARAQKIWQQTSFEERRNVLRDLMEIILDNKEHIANLSCQETGKTYFEAISGEVMTTLEKLRYTIKMGEKALKPSHRYVPLILSYKTARVEYYPLGVIGAIIPWNYPFHNAMSPAISSIFCGNACVVKVSEHASLSRLYYQALIQTVLKRRGHDTNLVQFISGYGDTGAALIKAPEVNKVIFIGSPMTGKKVLETAAPLLKPVVLELGGKDPFIVLDNVELDLVVEKAIQGSFWNCGQNCISAERILVHKAIYKQFLEVAHAKLSKLSQGYNPKQHDLDFGAMTMQEQLEKVSGLVQEALAEGATLVYGGEVNQEQGKRFYKPTILTNVSPSMRIVREEVFGPVMLVLPFDNESDAVAQANEAQYGLGCTVWCKDIKRAEDLARKVVSGMVVVNDYGFNYMLQDLPFGGYKISGFGKFNGPEGLRSLCIQKSIASENILGKFMSGSMKAPAFSRYPRTKTAASLMEQALVIFYGWGFFVKLKAFFTFLRLLITG